jgi:hypothetical protein
MLFLWSLKRERKRGNVTGGGRRLLSQAKNNFLKMVTFRVCDINILNYIMLFSSFMDLNRKMVDCLFVGENSFTSTRWSGEHFQHRAMSILRSTAWSFGQLTRSVQNPSSGMYLFSLLSLFVCHNICLCCSLIFRYLCDASFWL